jgi:hypothetical protein
VKIETVREWAKNNRIVKSDDVLIICPDEKKLHETVRRLSPKKK